MTFGEAIEELKNDRRVTRKGWNGKNMLIYLGYFGNCDPCIIMRTAQGTFQPGWLASQADILAEDWEVV